MRKGFTLIELLIVVALIGILAVALLSAINPIEQAKKARDAGRKSDAAELLNAYERYYSTYGCYPWNGGAGTACGSTTLSGAVNPDFATGGNSERLLPAFSGEIKEQFKSRDSVTNATVTKRLYVSETTAGAVSVCFEPESTNARVGGLGPLKNVTNTATATCTGTYPNQSCYVCVPQ